MESAPCCEQVYLISETGELETALVLGSFAYDNQPNPSTDGNVIAIHCDDGAAFSYNHDSHLLTIDLPNESKTAIRSDVVTVDCHDAYIHADDFNLSANRAAIDAELIINGIPYKDHTHKNVQSGRSSTGGVNA